MFILFCSIKQRKLNKTSKIYFIQHQMIILKFLCIFILPKKTSEVRETKLCLFSKVKNKHFVFSKVSQTKFAKSPWLK